MTGLARLPDLPTDSVTNAPSTLSDTTYPDGGTFDQLVAKVSSAPQRQSSTPTQRNDHDRAHVARSTTTDVALSTDGAAQGLVLLDSSGHSPKQPTADAAGQNDSSDTHVGRDVIAASSAASHHTWKASKTEPNEVSTKDDQKSAIEDKDVAMNNTADPNSEKSNRSNTVSSGIGQSSRNSSAPSLSVAVHSSEKSGPTSVTRTSELGSRRSIGPNEQGQHTTDSSQVGHESHSVTTSPGTAQVTSNSNNSSAASPVNLATTNVRQNTTHNGELPGVASQLLSVISPLRQTPGGGQILTISLHPEGLGEVRVSLMVTDGQTNVRLVASTPEGADAIRGSLGSLESGLSDGRQQAHVFLGNELSGSGQQNQGGDGDDRQRSSAADSPPAGQSQPELDPSSMPDALTTQITTRLINMRI